MQKAFLNTDRWLLVPHNRLTDPEKIQRSRLLSTILLVLLFMAGLILTIVLRHDPDDINEPTVRGGFFLSGIMLVMYIFNRMGFTSFPATGLTLAFTALFIYIPFYSGEDPVFLAFLIIPIILTAIFFSIRWTTFVSVGILVLVAILLSFIDQSTEDTPYWNLRNMLFFLMLATGMILTFMRHLGNMEQIRKRELQKVNQELQQQIAELERFTYTVSHDLRNPLVTIRGFLGMLKKDLHDHRIDKVQSDFQRIAGATDKMDELLSDLLELSRVGRIINPPEEVDLARLVQDATDTVEARLRSKHVAVNVSPSLPTIHGDRIRLREVLENLIDNAVKYMGDQRNPVIEIGSNDRQGEQVIFVKDNGIGIEARYHAKIFHLFEKLDPTIEGTGIGLALVKRIIEVHGGRIWVESEGQGKGSTFCFTIPDSEK
jgi:signal transduction histidine kinase